MTSCRVRSCTVKHRVWLLVLVGMLVAARLASAASDVSLPGLAVHGGEEKFVEATGYQTDAEKEGNSAGIEIKNGDMVASTGKGCTWRDPSFAQRGDHPVVQVSWNDAQTFCAWLSKKSGKTVGLPTEAQ